jgi:hypothetical protein
MKRYCFKARIVPGDSGSAAVLFPYDVEKEFGTRGDIPVQATLDGELYRGSLMNCGTPSHMLGVLKSIREKIGKGPGDVIDVVLWRDGQTRAVRLPGEFAACLRDQDLLPAFEKLSYTHRKEYVRWITEAKNEQTRQNRMARAIDLLRKGVKTPAYSG